MCSNNKIVKYDNDEYDFERGDELTDMKLIVENKVLFVHKAVLSNLIHKFMLIFTDSIFYLKVQYLQSLKECLFQTLKRSTMARFFSQTKSLMIFLKC